MPKKKKKTLKAKPARKKARKITKKKAVKKTVKRKAVVRKQQKAKKSKVALKLKENAIGVVTHYFPKVRAAVIKLKAPLATGDTIKIKGHTTDFTQTVSSLQIDRVPINSAKKGEEIGLLVNSRVRQRDVVYKP